MLSRCLFSIISIFHRSHETWLFCTVPNHDCSPFPFAPIHCFHIIYIIPCPSPHVSVHSRIQQVANRGSKKKTQLCHHCLCSVQIMKPIMLLWMFLLFSDTWPFSWSSYSSTSTLQPRGGNRHTMCEYNSFWRGLRLWGMLLWQPTSFFQHSYICISSCGARTVRLCLFWYNRTKFWGTQYSQIHVWFCNLKPLFWG